MDRVVDNRLDRTCQQLDEDSDGEEYLKVEPWIFVLSNWYLMMNWKLSFEGEGKEFDVFKLSPECLYLTYVLDILFWPSCIKFGNRNYIV